MKISDYLIFFATVVVIVMGLAMVTMSGDGDTDSPKVFADGYVDYKVTSVNDKTVEVVMFHDSPEVLSIPETVLYGGEAYTVTSVKKSAFEGCMSLVSLTIPNTVKSLGVSAFKDCQRLSQLTVPVSLDVVVSQTLPAFEGCSVITTVTLTPGNGDVRDYNSSTYTPWYISKDVFKSLTVSDGVKSIGANMFSGCDGLQDIGFCDELESIGENAFDGIKFYDSDGETLLSVSADHLRGFEFVGNSSKMVKV